MNPHSQRTDPTWNQLDAIVKKHGLEKLSLMDTADLIWRLEQSGPADDAKDAARYRWLRDRVSMRHGETLSPAKCYYREWYHRTTFGSKLDTPPNEAFDAAIDEARSSATDSPEAGRG